MKYEEYNTIIDQMIGSIKKSGIKIDNVYAIPRGGYYPAIRTANALNIPIVTELGNNTLVIDDLCDSGKTMSNYKNYNTAAVFMKEHSQFVPTFFGKKIENEWINFPDEHETTIEENIRRIFEYIGENPNREGLKDTPSRIVRMYKEIFRGYDQKQAPKITTFQNGADGIVYDNMVIDEGDFYSCCEHHMMPFFGHYWFAYIPNPKGKIIGISKIGRTVDFCAARMQIQERLVQNIVEMIKNALGTENPPLGIALVMKGEHLCKSMRGAKKKGTMTSSYLDGIFKENAEARKEFMSFCK